MANFSVNIPDDFMADLLRLDEDACKQIVEEAAPILVTEIKVQIRQRGFVDTGELLDSIVAQKPYVNKNGKWSIMAGPKGNSKRKKNRGKPISNALKLIWIEYGIPKKEISARPFLETARRNVEEAVLNNMQETYNRLAVRQ